MYRSGSQEPDLPIKLSESEKSPFQKFTKKKPVFQRALKLIEKRFELLTFVINNT